MSRRPLLTERPSFRAAATTVVPEAAGLNEAGWARLGAIVEDALADRPAARRQLGVFLRAIEWLPTLRWGRRFSRLTPEHRRAFLAGLQDAPLLLVRRGFWGLRTLVYMGYYGQEEVRARIGYRAHPDGWKARPGGPDPERTEPVGLPLDARTPLPAPPGEVKASGPPGDRPS